MRTLGSTNLAASVLSELMEEILLEAVPRHVNDKEVTRDGFMAS